jgi:hypothetical protein
MTMITAVAADGDELPVQPFLAAQLFDDGLSSSDEM